MNPVSRRWVVLVFGVCLLVALALSRPRAAAPPVSAAAHRSPTDLVVTADEKWLLTANRTADSVSLVELASGKIVAEAPAGRRPRALVLTPDDSRVLVTATHSGELIVFALGDGTLKREGAVATFVLVVASLCLAAPLGAGKFNKKVSVGDAAPSFSKLPGTDGKDHSLAQFEDKDVVVVVVTCNHCPVAVAYEDRIIAFTKKYASEKDSKVAIVAINVNNLDADKMDKMKERAKAKGFNFPYLYDASQEIGKKYGASVTPEFFVLNKDRKIAYVGAMDDSQTASKVKEKYLEDAVDALLAGKTIATTETKARGCGVKYDK